MACSVAPPVRRRLLTLLAGGALAAAALAGPGQLAPAAAQSAPGPHWGPYRWDGGSVAIDVRAFWIVDRTGNRQMHDVIKVVTDAWNSARDQHPELPYIGVYVDDANAGKCFVNHTTGYSVATACMIPPNFLAGVQGIAVENPGDDGHFVGAAFAVTPGLSDNDAITVVCHSVGQVIGLHESDDPSSCMSSHFTSGPAKWYTQDDGMGILDLYSHSDTAPTTTSTEPATTTTSVETTTTAGPTTSTTVAPTTTTEAPTTTEPVTVTLPVTVPTTVP